MAEMTLYAKAVALLAVFSNATVALTRGGAAVTDPGVTPQPFILGDPEEGPTRGSQRVTNRAEVRFGPWQEDAPGPVDGWAVLDATGSVLARGALLEDPPPRRTDERYFPAGTLEFSFR